MTLSQLEAEATRLLRKNGYDWAGRPLRKTKEERQQDHHQQRFERVMVRSGFRGASRDVG